MIIKMGCYNDTKYQQETFADEDKKVEQYANEDEEAEQFMNLNPANYGSNSCILQQLMMAFVIYMVLHYLACNVLNKLPKNHKMIAMDRKNAMLFLVSLALSHMLMKCNQ